jgi:hypothetical protein
MEKSLSFDYSNFGRDILFEGIQPNSKDKKKRDFLDCCKCLVWEENRTRYDLDEAFRKKINFYKENINLRKPNYVDNIVRDTDLLTEGELYYFHNNYPYNVPNFPQYPYLKYTFSRRSRWRYDPTEGRKKYCRKLLFEGLTGDKDDQIYETQKVHLLKDKTRRKASELRSEKTLGKVITRTVPLTIHIDPLVDPSVSKQIINQNFDEIMDVIRAEKIKMEAEGYQFLTREQIEEVRKLEKDYVEFNNGIYSAFDPLFKPKTLKIYNSALQFLGLYRLLYCEGLKWYEIEKRYEKHFKRAGEIPMSLNHYNSKAKNVLKHFEHKKIYN